MGRGESMAEIKGSNGDIDYATQQVLSQLTGDQKTQIDTITKDVQTRYKKAKKTAWIALPIVVVIIAVVALISKDPEAILWAVIVAVFIMAGIIGSVYAYCDNMFKKEVVPQLVKLVYGQDAVFNLAGGWAESYLKNFNLFRFGNRYSTDTQIAGSYQGVKFSVANVTTQNVETDSKGHTTTTTYFRGLVIVYEFNKEFPGSMEIREEENGYGRSMNFPYSAHIDFEDIVFNKEFNVYANDKESAFYVITPQFIEAFKEIKQRIPGSLIFCIRDKRLILAISGARNKFDYAVKAKSTDEVIVKLIREIIPFRWFVELFNLSDSFGKKSLEEARAAQAYAEAHPEAAAAATLPAGADNGDNIESAIENKANSMAAESYPDQVQSKVESIGNVDSDKLASDIETNTEAAANQAAAAQEEQAAKQTAAADYTGTEPTPAEPAGTSATPAATSTSTPAADDDFDPFAGLDK